MAANLKLRSDFTFAIRQALHNRAFTEVETPALFKSTPEGARDFLVPSRTQPGHFYALPQTPQLLKQLLMVGGVERYYQVAKCFRDEDLRADRQPEFTQVDIEMTFVDQDDVMGALEDVLRDAFGQDGRRAAHARCAACSYWDAMDTYGVDKPDTRYGMDAARTSRPIFVPTPSFKLFASRRWPNDRGLRRQVPSTPRARAPGRAPRSTSSQDVATGVWRQGPRLHRLPSRTAPSPAPSSSSSPTRRWPPCASAPDVEPGDLVMFAAGEPPCRPTRSSAACAATWPTPSTSPARATTSSGSSTSRSSTGTRTARPTRPSTSPSPCPPRPTSSQDRGRPAGRRQLHLRLRHGRLRGRRRRHAHPRRRHAGWPCSSSSASPPERAPRAVRLPHGRPRVRRASHGRLCPGPRPRVHAAHRLRLHPRGHGLPQDLQRQRTS